MNRTLGNNNLENADVPGGSDWVKPTLTWVKPSLERLSLKEALGASSLSTTDCTLPNTGS